MNAISFRDRPSLTAPDSVPHCDVAILGGGLAGMTLARQLRSRLPESSIVVLEKRAFPVGESAYKVGESTVEIGAHYLAEVVGLKKHLIDEQLPKFGLRFFFQEGGQPLEQAAEVGASEFFAAPGYQVDRGRLENYLATQLRREGVSIVQGKANQITSSDDGELGRHHVRYQNGAVTGDLHARWVVDASGRAGWLKRQWNLADNIRHDVNAVWFRVNAEVRVDDWCDDPEWRMRVGKIPRRWLSTNHLLGRGYWIWIIPLPTGATSIGLVADPRFHRLAEINRPDRLDAWLRRHQPRLADALEPHRDKRMDFLAARQLARASRQVFSQERWALTGEAAVFLDPLYSPGIDYIAIGNTMICKLIEVDLAGGDLDTLAQQLENTFQLLFQNNLLTYQDQYGLFGNPRVMSLKYLWDYAVYWGFPALLYFNDKLTDASFLQSLGRAVEDVRSLNQRMQQFFRQWDEQDPHSRLDAVYVDQHQIELLTRLNAELQDRLDDAALRQRILANVALLRDIQSEIRERVERRTPGPTGAEVDAPSVRRLDHVFELLEL